MIVTSVAEKLNSPHHVGGPGWTSTRLLVKAHGLGYSLNDTHVEANTEMRLHYTEHIETNYCIGGSGEVVDVATGQIYPLAPGSVYTLDRHDEHILRAGPQGLHLACVFTPPLAGDETHRADGSYAADTSDTAVSPTRATADTAAQPARATTAMPPAAAAQPASQPDAADPAQRNDAPPARVDHVVVHVGQQLDEAFARYTRLGFQLTPRGHHTLGSSNHLAIFGSDYLELLGVEAQDVEKFGDGWNHPTGLSGLVFKTPDAARLWARLAAHHVPVEGQAPAAFHRPVTLPDGQVRDARFRTVRLAAARVPNGRAFFCEQLTPELVWRPEWQQHANGATGILEYVYLMPQPGTLPCLLERAVDPGGLAAIDHGLALRLGDTRVLFLTPAGVAARFGVAPQDLPPDAPRAVALTLRTRSLVQARKALDAGGIMGVRAVADQVVVPADQAGGVILGFKEGPAR